MFRPPEEELAIQQYGKLMYLSQWMIIWIEKDFYHHNLQCQKHKEEN